MANPGDPQVEKRVSLQLADFLSSGKWKPSGLSKDSAAAVTKAFFEACYRDLGVPPDRLDAPELEQALLEHLPPRLNPSLEGVEAAPRLVGAILQWCGERKLNPNAWRFPEVLERAGKQFPKLLERSGGAALASEPGKPYERPGSKVGRNDPCPCGSGKKYKKCCSGLLGGK